MPSRQSSLEDKQGEGSESEPLPRGGRGGDGRAPPPGRFAVLPAPGSTSSPAVRMECAPVSTPSTDLLFECPGPSRHSTDRYSGGFLPSGPSISRRNPAGVIAWNTPSAAMRAVRWVLPPRPLPLVRRRLLRRWPAAAAAAWLKPAPPRRFPVLRHRDTQPPSAAVASPNPVPSRGFVALHHGDTRSPPTTSASPNPAHSAFAVRRHEDARPLLTEGIAPPSQEPSVRRLEDAPAGLAMARHELMVSTIGVSHCVAKLSATHCILSSLLAVSAKWSASLTMRGVGATSTHHRWMRFRHRRGGLHALPPLFAGARGNICRPQVTCPRCLPVSRRAA